MGWRFRKSFKIAPGVKLNVNKKSVGVTFGGKGAHYTINSKGTHTSSVGLPGTGLYYTDINNKNNQVKNLRKNNRISSKSKRFFIFIFFTCIILAVYLSFSTSPQNKSIIEPQTSESVSLSCAEILNLNQHPIIYSDFEKAKNFYEAQGIDTVKALTVPQYSSLQNEIKTFSDDNVLIYLLADPTFGKYVGELHINIYESDLYSQMNVEQALDTIVSYIPTDFFVYYENDSAFKYSLNNTDINICSFRLNERGVEYHNNGHEEYSYYYSFKIFHRKDIKRWSLYTSYEAYGGKGLEWIKKYSDSWEIDLKKYL